MTSIEERNVLRSGLEALDAAIADTSAAVRLAETPDETKELRARLVILKLMRTNLETRLLQRSASPGSVSGINVVQSAELASLDAALNKVKGDRRVLHAAVKRSDAVIGKVQQLQILLSGDDPTADLIADLGTIGVDPTDD